MGRRVPRESTCTPVRERNARGCAAAMPIPAGWERGEGARLSAIALVVLALHGVVAASFFHRSLDADEIVKPHRIPIVVRFVTAMERAPAKAAPFVTTPDARQRTTRRPESAAVHGRVHADTVDRNSALSRIAPPKREPVPSSPHSRPAQAQDPQGTSTERAAQPVPSPASKSAATQDRQDEGGAHSSAHDAEADTAPLFEAAYLHNPAPDYPPMALQRRWEGTVLLNVHVLATGSAGEVTVIASSGHESLDDAAREAVAAWRFVPARRAGRTTDAWVHVPVVFKAA